MSENAHIDKIFKDNLGEKNFSGRDAMWQKMEATLEKEDRKKKKRMVFMILFALLVGAGFFAANKIQITPSTNDATIAGIKKAATPGSDVQTATVKNEPAAENNLVQKTPGSSTYNSTGATLSKAVVAPSAGAFKSTLLNGEEGTTDISTSDNPVTPSVSLVEKDSIVNLPAEKIQAAAATNSISYLERSAVIIQPVSTVNNRNTILEKNKKEPAKIKSLSIELIAGGDALRMNRRAGYYAGIRVNRLLEKGTVVSVGLSYTGNTVNDKYRLASKPAERREADAKISDINMIRMPIYFQRQLATSRFALMAGLIPSYVVDAAVYNVPGSFTGNPEQFRKFTMKDINRFNVLFGAGIKYAPLNRVAFELSGSYGFTSLVKNSYTNQSRVNDNFKSVQMGVVLKLK